MTQVNKKLSERVSQGDIIRDVEFIEYAIEKDGIIEVSKIIFPLVYVLTQDCDLNQDYTYRVISQDKGEDKQLMSVIVAPLYNAKQFIAGEHLSLIERKMRVIKWKNTEGEYIRSNNSPRYHYLEFHESIPVVPSVIDFKHYFTVSIEYLHKLKKENYVCCVSELFRENISQRYCSFLARIGLPTLE